MDSPLLDITAELDRLGRGCSEWSVKIWPTCQEATVAAVYERRSLTDVSVRAHVAGWVQRDAWNGPVDRDYENESVRRARGAARRYQRHNGLREMVTLTFAGQPPEYADLSQTMAFFFRRLKRRLGYLPPYLWVPEWGKETGRLHVHMAVDWWESSGAVEVCKVCATERLLAARDDVPEAGAFCVGCLWGHGFVGRPECNTDGRGLSQYLTKYLGKDFGEGLISGSQRYRVGEGALPSCELVRCESVDEAFRVVLAHRVGDLPESMEMPVMYVPQSSGLGALAVASIDWIRKVERSSQSK